MTLAGYNGDFTEGEFGTIVLSTSGITLSGDAAVQAKIDAVLKSMYGDDYATSVKLAYDEWGNTVVTFQDSSYAGQTDQLVGTVTNLTGALSDFMGDENFSTDLFGANFNGYLGGLGIDPTQNPTAAGNAAVLYVAQNTAGKDDVVKNAVADAITEVDGQGLTTGSDEWADAVVQAMSSKLTNNDTGLGMAGGMAAMYAYAEAFGQYHSTQTGSTTVLDDFHDNTKFEEVTNANDALNDIESAFKTLLLSGSSSVGSYLDTSSGKSQSDKDLEGYVSALGMVNQSSASLEGSLGNTEAFTNVANSLLTQYLSVEEGEIGIMFRYSEGIMTFTNTIPENAD